LEEQEAKQQYKNNSQRSRKNLKKISSPKMSLWTHLTIKQAKEKILQPILASSIIQRKK
jgi:hypothetical protein